MSNDTPPQTPIPGSDDSQAPLIDERNAATDASVAPDMNDDTTPIAQGPDDGEAAPLTSTTFAGTALEGPAADASHSGDTARTEPVTRPSAIEPAPFDYDSYYGVDPAWEAASPSRPVPVTTPSDTIGQPPAPKKSRDGVMFFVGALAAGVLGAALTVGVLAATGTLSSDDAPAAATTTQAQASAAQSDTPATITNTIIENDLGAAVNPTAVAAKTIPSIVTVTTFSGSTGDTVTPQGSGSGVVLTSDGYIATNQHVVDGGSEYAVTFEDGSRYQAELVGSDELTDLAVLKIGATDLVPIEFGSTDDLLLGDPAVAVGNPLGQEGGSSISSGIISAFDRRVDFGDGSSLFGMIQTDAAINSGSSGGALVNAEGQLIGITSAIGVSNAGPEGIGYAIPVELVRRITDEIIETGDVVHPFLGVTIGDYTEEKPDGAIRPAGAEVVTIEGTDSAAGTAGIQAGDIIVEIGDEEITSQTDLILAVRLNRVGDEVRFGVLRNGEPLEFTVTLGQRPEAFGG
jgi:serine protease Do